MPTKPNPLTTKKPYAGPPSSRENSTPNPPVRRGTPVPAVPPPTASHPKPISPTPTGK